MIATHHRAGLERTVVSRIKVLIGRTKAYGRTYRRAVELGAAILIGQIGEAGDDAPLREPYPIVRVAERDSASFARGERIAGIILTQPLEVSDKGRSGVPGGAPN
jgi:hypothetical protein